MNNAMRKSIHFSPAEINRVEEIQKKHDINDFSKAVRFLIKSAFDERTFFSIGVFTRCMAELNEISVAISKIGNNLNQLVKLYHHGKVPQAGDLVAAIKELQDLMHKNLLNNAELSSSIKFNEPQ